MTPGRGETHRTASDEPPEDLSFGGWRDWLLVLLAAPIFVGGLVATAFLELGSRRPVSLFELVVVVLLALVGGLLAHRVMRWWREP